MDIAGGTGRGGRPVGLVVERLYRHDAVVAVARQDGEHLGKPVRPLPRSTAGDRVDLDMGDQPARQPPVQHGGNRLGLAHPRRGGIDHGAQSGLADPLDQRGRLGHRVDEVGLPPIQRLDAVRHPDGSRGGPRRGEVFFGRGQSVLGIPIGHRPLLRRAVNQHGAAEFGAQVDKPPYHVACGVDDVGARVGDRQARRRQQQPVQPRDCDAGVGGLSAQRCNARGRQVARVVAQGEGGDLQTAIAEPSGVIALSGKIAIAQDFVAQRQDHSALPDGAVASAAAAAAAGAC